MYSQNILITGSPGIGKTTLIKKVYDDLKDLDPVGFYTLEIREGGKRVGFRMISFDGREGILSHVGIKGPNRVSKYGVNVDGFDRFLAYLDLLNTPSSLVLIDEIAKMECLSGKFRRIMNDLLDSDKIVIVTVAIRGKGLIEEVKGREDCEVYEVKLRNRDQLPAALADEVRQRISRSTSP
jgi:nucleoside-triphosphatase